MCACAIHELKSSKKDILVPRGRAPFGQHQEITTSGLVQRHSVFEWLCEHNRLKPEPIRFVRLDSEHAQSDGKSVNRGLPVLDLARGRDFLVLTKRSAASGDENAKKTKEGVNHFLFFACSELQRRLRFFSTYQNVLRSTFRSQTKKTHKRPSPSLFTLRPSLPFPLNFDKSHIS